MVNYTPTVSGAFGFALSLVSDDGDETPYTITASGTATGAPEIAITSSEGGAVADGGTDTFASSKAAASAATVTYTITNSGTGPLTITAPTVGGNISGATNVTVNSLTLDLDQRCCRGGTTTLVVNYTPTVSGAFGFALSLVSDDGDETPYTITASGTATGAPEIAITSSEGGAVADGGTDTFASSKAAASAATVTYTITNSGTGPLTITAPTVGGNISGATNVTVNSLTLDLDQRCCWRKHDNACGQLYAHGVRRLRFRAQPGQ